MEDDHAKRLERCLEIAVDNRKLEIELLWKRTAIFWAFVVAIFAAAAAALDKRPELAIALSLTGVVFSLIWTLVNRGGRSWQESWELKADEFFRERYGYSDLFNRWMPQRDRRFVVLRSRPYSVSGLLVALSDFVVLFWIGFSVYAFDVAYGVHAVAAAFSARRAELGSVFVLLYCIYVLITARSSDESRRIVAPRRGEPEQLR